jgi:curved DNA-binding protein CbpA
MTAAERVDVLSGDAGARVRRAKTRELAGPLVQNLFRLVKLAQLHAIDNQAVRRQLELTAEGLRDYALRSGEGATLFFARGVVFFGGEPLKASRSVYESALELSRVLERCGGAELSFAPDVSLGDLRTFVMAVAATLRDANARYSEFDVPRVRVRAVSDAAALRGLDVESLDPEQRIVRTYSSAIVVLRRFFESLDEGQLVLPKRIKRIAQSLVDLSAGRTPAFLGVTAVRNANHDEAGKAVNTAILAVAMARQLTDQKVTLTRIAMAAMLGDVGGARARLAMRGEDDADAPAMMVRLGDEAERRLPAGSAAVLTALGRVNEPSIVRTVVGFEAAWIRRTALLGALYRGKRPPVLHARIVALARAYNELLTPDPGEPARAPADALLQLDAEVSASGQSADRTVLRLLMSATGLLPPGSLVQLSSGEVAVVVDVDAGPRPLRLRPVIDEHGGIVELPQEFALGDDDRTIAKIVGSDPSFLARRALSSVTPSRPSPSVAPVTTPTGPSTSRVREFSPPSASVRTAPAPTSVPPPSTPTSPSGAMASAPPSTPSIAAPSVRSGAQPIASRVPLPPERDPLRDSSRGLGPAARASGGPFDAIDEPASSGRLPRADDATVVMSSPFEEEERALAIRAASRIADVGSDDGSNAGHDDDRDDDERTRARLPAASAPAPSSARPSPSRPLPSRPSLPPATRPGAQRATAPPPPRSRTIAPTPSATQSVAPPASVRSAASSITPRAPSVSPPTNSAPRRPQPDVQGTLARSPLPHLMVHVLSRGLTGTLIVRADGDEHVIVFDEGAPQKLRTTLRSPRIGALLAEKGIVEASRVEAAAAKAKARGLPIGKQLVMEGALGAREIMGALRWQMMARASAMLELPRSAGYEFHTGWDELPSVEALRCEPLAFTLALLRNWRDEAAVEAMDATLARLGDRPIKLHAASRLARFDLGEEEELALEWATSAGLSYPRLLEDGVAAVEVVRPLVYALAVLRHIDFGENSWPIGVPQDAPSDEPHFADEDAGRMSFAPPAPPSFAGAPSSRRVESAPPASDPIPSSRRPIDDAASLGEVRISSRAPAMPSGADEYGASFDLATPPPAKAKPKPPSPPPSRAAIDAELATEIDERLAAIGSPTHTHYDALGLSTSATTEAVREAFLRAAKRFHPDKLPTSLSRRAGEVATLFAAVSEAHRVLSDASLRGEYDRELAGRESKRAESDEVERVLEAAALYQKAEIAMKRSDRDGAEQMLRRAVELDPSTGSQLALLGWVVSLSGAGKLSEALEFLDRAVKASDGNDRAHYYRGTVFKRLGRTQDAIRDFRRAVELNPKNIDAVRELRLHEMRAQRRAQPESTEDAGLFGSWFRKKK